MDIEKPVMDGRRALQRERRASLGQLASELLANALAANSKKISTAPKLGWIARPMKAKIDIGDKDVLHRHLDGDQ